MNSPRAEIVSTGTELLQGLYTDRNACALASRLDALGFRAVYTHAARDCPGEIEALLAAAARRADVIVMTGGLGPTVDDCNRDVIARLWEAPARLDATAERMMRERFESRGIPMPENNIVQAMIPEGATVFYNHNGTAPGFALPARGSRDGERLAALVALPGPPGEWTLMWESGAAPWLRAQFPNLPARHVITRHFSMIPESVVNDRIADLFAADPRAEVTILAARGHIRLRVTATDASPDRAERLAEEMMGRALERLPREVILSGSAPEWTLEEELGALLRGSGRRIATAESCTGGLVAARLTDIPGSSEYFVQGFITYSNEAKARALGVSEETLRRYGAVSAECAREMAAGARRAAGAVDAALAITGIAGPGGGSAEKPVGLVWFALDSADRGAVTIRRLYRGQRDSVREWAARQGLDLLRRWAANLPWPPETG